MKQLFATILLGATLVVYGQDPVTLRLVIRNFDHDQGKVRAGLYNSAEHWLKKPFRGVDTVIYNTQEVVVIFADIPTGEYAISIYHDENENGELDSNVLGIPSEDYAFSNNAAGMFGPASYKDSAFEVAESETVHTIKLN